MPLIGSSYPAAMDGHYEGRVVATWLGDGRDMQIQEPFAYVDDAALRWDVPAQARVDGASIPRFLWTLVGGPFEGKYRDASVVHDWYCDVRTRPWRAVHRMFYEAMICSGVGTAQARMMYAGVMFGGPKWSENAISNSNLASGIALQRSGKFDIAAAADMSILSRIRLVDDSVRAFAEDLGVRPKRVATALSRIDLGANKATKPALHFRPSRAKAEGVTLAAASLDLDAIDALVAHESKGLKLVTGAS